MSSIETPMKRKFGDLEKTPTSLLYELGAKENKLVIFESVPHETDPKMFSCLVNAFDMVCKGSGRSKQDAKHEASANLIALLKSMDRYKETFQEAPEASQNAITVLVEICVQRNLPVPKFELAQSSGQPHKPLFTYICQVSNIKRTGTFSTKKGAKQIAARNMIEALQNLAQNEEQKQIATVEAEPAEKIFRLYRGVKQLPAKPRAVQIRMRHNFFLELPEADRTEAAKILMDDESVIYGTAKDRVDLACAALNLKYGVSIIPNHSKNFKVFYLQGDYDCVLAAKEDDLYNEVIAHFKTMLDLQQF